MMKRLFVVRNSKGNVVGIGDDYREGCEEYCASEFHFADKMVAKGYREHLGGVENGFHISRGPDHIGKHSGYHIPYMRRQPKK